jgi:hypothetical protein
MVLQRFIEHDLEPDQSTSILLTCPQVLCLARDHDPCIFSSLRFRPAAMLCYVLFLDEQFVDVSKNQSAFFSVKQLTESGLELLDPDDEGSTVL